MTTASMSEVSNVQFTIQNHYVIQCEWLENVWGEVYPGDTETELRRRY